MMNYKILGTRLFTRNKHLDGTISVFLTAPQHLVCRVMQSLHINHMQMGIIEVFTSEHFNDTHLHMVDMQTLHNSAY